MSVIGTDGAKVVLRRRGASALSHYEDQYVGACPRRLKNLALFHLRETAGWPYRRIARAEGMPQTTVFDRVKSCAEALHQIILDEQGKRSDFPDD